MKNAILDFRASKKCVDALLDMNFNVVKTPKLENVCEQICGHTDIMLHCTADGIAVVEETVYGYYKDRLKNVKLIKGKAHLGARYPHDIAYNAARVGNRIFCNEKFTNEEILRYYREHEYRIVDIKQGYAKCSICIVSDDAIITSDMGICRAAEKSEIDVLLASDDEILLPGFDHGFIGGATGLLDKKTLAICGDAKYLRDCEKIMDFCGKYGVDVLSLCDGAPLDVGSITVI